VNWDSITYQIGRYAKAFGIAWLFVLLRFGMVALLSWASGLEPYWLKLLVLAAAALVAGVAAKMFFLWSPNRFKFKTAHD